MQIHWLSIINSFVLVVILTVFLGIILLRIIKNDFTRIMDGDEVHARFAGRLLLGSHRLVAVVLVLLLWLLLFRRAFWMFRDGCALESSILLSHLPKFLMYSVVLFHSAGFRARNRYKPVN